MDVNIELEDDNILNVSNKILSRWYHVGFTDALFGRGPRKRRSLYVFDEYLAGRRDGERKTKNKKHK